MIQQRIAFGRIVLLVLAALTAAGCDMFTGAEKRLDRAEQQMAAFDYNSAYIELKNVLQDEPDNARAHFALAEVVLQLGDPSHAGAELKQALQLAAEDPAPRSKEMIAKGAQLDARVRLAMGNGAQVLADIDGGKLVLPEPWRSVYRGQALLSMRRPAEAADEFSKVLASRPADTGAGLKNPLVLARIGLAQAYAGQHDAKRALQEIEAVISGKPDIAEAWIVKSAVLAALGREADSEQALEQARKYAAQLTVAQHKRLLAALADSKLRRKDIDSAQELRDSLAKFAEGAPITRILTARIAIARKDYTAAVAELQRVLQDAPDFNPARILLASVFLAQGNLQQAETHLNQVMQKAPENPVAQQLLAKVRKQLGRPEPEQPKTLSPQEKEALARRSQTRIDPRFLQAERYMQEGKRDKAIVQYEDMLKSRPDNPIVLNNLAWLYYETRDSRALATARRAYRLAPKVPHILDTYGWILVNAGQVDEGLKLLQQAAAASDHPQVDKHYAEAQALSKKK